MQIISYESANRYKGLMPVHFLSLGKGELEKVIESDSDGLRINPTRYQEIAAKTSDSSQAQVHYVLLDKDLYRIFVGRIPTSRLEYGVVKSVVRIGTVSENLFAQLIPSDGGLSESQINRSIRKAIRANKNN